MDEMMKEMMNQFEQLHNVAILMKEVEDKVKDYSFEVKCSMMCMMFDVLFKEKSVETAELCLEQIKAVNSEIGVWDGEKSKCDK